MRISQYASKTRRIHLTVRLLDYANKPDTDFHFMLYIDSSKIGLVSLCLLPKRESKPAAILRLALYYTLSILYN